jgi:hypothetical protein
MIASSGDVGLSCGRGPSPDVRRHSGGGILGWLIWDTPPPTLRSGWRTLRREPGSITDFPCDQFIRSPFHASDFRRADEQARRVLKRLLRDVVGPSMRSFIAKA